jgi:ribosomal protein S18 acetylase RimI-like enzyme
MARSLNAALSAGYSTVSLGVDAESQTNAVRLYERLGFTIDQTEITLIKHFA